IRSPSSQRTKSFRSDAPYGMSVRRNIPKISARRVFLRFIASTVSGCAICEKDSGGEDRLKRLPLHRNAHHPRDAHTLSPTTSQRKEQECSRKERSTTRNKRRSL